jgi:hypothetical protein
LFFFGAFRSNYLVGRRMTCPAIIQFVHDAKILDEEYLEKLADLVRFYWEFRYDNPEMQLAEA